MRYRADAAILAAMLVLGAWMGARVVFETGQLFFY
jgi:hypothetical protein